SEILRAWGGRECRTHVPGELISPSVFGDLVSQIERLVVACLMNSHHGVFLMHQNLHELCGRLFGFFSESLQNRELDPLQRAHQFLLDHYTRSISLSEIGSRVGFSPNYLS